MCEIDGWLIFSVVIFSIDHVKLISSLRIKPLIILEKKASPVIYIPTFTPNAKLDLTYLTMVVRKFTHIVYYKTLMVVLS